MVSYQPNCSSGKRRNSELRLTRHKICFNSAFNPPFSEISQIYLPSTLLPQTQYFCITLLKNLFTHLYDEDQQNS